MSQGLLRARPPPGSHFILPSVPSGGRLCPCRAAEAQGTNNFLVSCGRDVHERGPPQVSDRHPCPSLCPLRAAAGVIAGPWH